MPRPPRLMTSIALLVVGLLGGVSAWGGHEDALSSRAMRALGTVRTTRARFSEQPAYAPCEATERCAPVRSSDSLLVVAADVVRAFADSPTRDAARAAALVEALGGRLGNRLDRSISLFEMATTLSSPNDPSAIDLAAAHLLRATASGRARDAIDALDAAERAAVLRPRDPAARFNQALALELMTLDDEAAEAWQAYLALDDSSGWAAEARQHLTSLARAHFTEPTETASPDDWRAFALVAPWRARELAWTQLLGGWGEAFGVDAARADARLAAARAVGTALVAQRRDGTVARAVAAIDAAGGGRGTLARAHAAYRAAQRAFAAQRLAEAAAEADRAQRGASTDLRLWAQLVAANTHVLRGDLAAAANALPRIAEGARHPAQQVLRGRALWSMGTTAARQGRYADALTALVEAESLFARTGEVEGRGAVQEIQGGTYFAMGAEDRGFEAEARAARTLRAHRVTPWLHNVLYSTSRAALARGRSAAAAAINREGKRVARQFDRPVLVIEAELLAARRAVADQDATTAARELTEAQQAIATLPGPVQKAFAAEWQFVEAQRVVASTPQTAVSRLDSVVAYYAPQGNVVKVMQALAERASANVALARVADVDRDLDSLAAILTRSGQSAGSAIDRERLRASIAAVTDQLVRLRLEAGDGDGAFAAVSRWRGNGVRGTTDPTRPLTLMLAGDRMAAWRVSGAERRWLSWRIDRRKFDATMARLRGAVELGASRRAVDAELAQLHEMLWRPVLPLVADTGMLTIVREGALGVVPFAALRDEARQRYVIEDRPIRFGGATAMMRAAPLGAPATPNGALIVAEPAADASLALAPLPGARDEAAMVATHVSAPLVLDGPAATRTRFLAALPSASLVHFAGHAVLDDARPEDSGLALAAGADESPLVRASELAALDLRRVRLVVLSACETWRSPGGTGGGFLSLGDAFLRAGAGGVVASTWRVDDGATRALMTALHDALRRGRAPPDALREAQLQMLRGNNAVHRSPASWAGFSYAGRDASLHSQDEDL